MTHKPSSLAWAALVTGTHSQLLSGSAPPLKGFTLAKLHEANAHSRARLKKRSGEDT